MTQTQPCRSQATSHAAALYERRRKAAWFDYLATVRDLPANQYDEIEQHAWARLQRRLARNEERVASPAGV